MSRHAGRRTRLLTTNGLAPRPAGDPARVLGTGIGVGARGVPVVLTVPPVLAPAAGGRMPVAVRDGDPHCAHSQDLLAIRVLHLHRGQVTRGVLQRGDSQPPIQTTAVFALGRGEPRFVVQPGRRRAPGLWRTGPAPAGPVMGAGVRARGVLV